MADPISVVIGEAVAGKGGRAAGKGCLQLKKVNRHAMVSLLSIFDSCYRDTTGTIDRIVN